MRIATWNCQGGLDKKMDVVAALDADVLVIQECAPSTKLSATPGVTSVWSPPYDGATKGTGVFARGEWSVAANEAVPSLPWVLPVTVTNRASGQQFALLAVWTNKNKDDGRPPYAEQFGHVLDHFGAALASGSMLIAGDINGSMQGPDIPGHRRNISSIESYGLVSAFHHANGVEHGAEPAGLMTLKWMARGKVEKRYHCDFVFVPVALAAGIASHVEPTFSWPTRVSDHQPVVADLVVN